MSKKRENGAGGKARKPMRLSSKILLTETVISLIASLFVFSSNLTGLSVVDFDDTSTGKVSLYFFLLALLGFFTILYSRSKSRNSLR